MDKKSVEEMHTDTRTESRRENKLDSEDGVRLNDYGAGLLHEIVEITSALIVFSCNRRKLFWVADDDDGIGTYRF